MKLEDSLLKNTVDWTAFITAVSVTIGWIASHILGVLSGIWLTLQIITWVKKKNWRNNSDE
jgi:hypothetical protein